MNSNGSSCEDPHNLNHYDHCPTCNRGKPVWLAVTPEGIFCVQCIPDDVVDRMVRELSAE